MATLRYYFISTETKLDGYLFDHWNNKVDALSDIFLSFKRELKQLLHLQELHDVVVAPFNQFPPQLLTPENFPETNQQKIYELIGREKETRIQLIINRFFAKMMEEQQIVGVFVPDKNDEFMKTYIPRTLTNDMDVEGVRNRSFKKVFDEVLAKYPPKKMRKEGPVKILVANVELGTQVDKILIENWLQVVQRTKDIDPEVKEAVIDLLAILSEAKVAVAPFNTLPYLDQSWTQLLNKPMSEGELMMQIATEMHGRLEVLERNFLKKLLYETRKTGGMIVYNYNVQIFRFLTVDGVSEEEDQRIRKGLMERMDSIQYALSQLHEKQEEIKADKFKEEALGVLQTHIERQKDALIPELDVFTGNVRLPSAPLRSPVIKVTDHDASQAAQDFIDLTTPPDTPVPETRTPADHSMTGDMLDLERGRPLVTTTMPNITSQQETNANEIKTLLDTTPPILIMSRAPLEPHQPEWYDTDMSDKREIMQPLQPIAYKPGKPEKTFMEAASDWIKYAQINLTYRDTAAGYNLQSEIMTAPMTTEPLQAPEIFEEEPTPKVNDDDTLIGF